MKSEEIASSTEADDGGDNTPTMTTLDAKPGAPVIDSGDLLAFLAERNIAVPNDTVQAHSDGSVDIDSSDPGLAAAWAAYSPPVPMAPVTLREQLQAQVDDLTTLDQLKAFIRDTLIPALIADE